MLLRVAQAHWRHIRLSRRSALRWAQCFARARILKRLSIVAIAAEATDATPSGTKLGCVKLPGKVGGPETVRGALKSSSNARAAARVGKRVDPT
jgi:hypothetical protein